MEDYGDDDAFLDEETYGLETGVENLAGHAIILRRTQYFTSTTEEQDF